MIVTSLSLAGDDNLSTDLSSVMPSFVNELSQPQARGLSEQACGRGRACHKHALQRYDGTEIESVQ
jgi:hypothetical protein